MILLDTTVLVYAVGEEHPLRAPSRWLLAAHGEGRIDATTTVEVLQEFLHIRSRRRPRPEAVALMREFATAFDVWVTSPDDLTSGAGLFERYPQLGALDAVLGAVALNRAVSALVSADHAFSGVEGVPWVDLADPGLQGTIEMGPDTPAGS